MKKTCLALSVIILQGCTGTHDARTSEYLVLDRLLVLPLEELITALENPAIWGMG